MNYQEWILCEEIPIYLQLYQRIQRSILGGQLSSGENLPSIREMASIVHVNANTVARAYKMACKDSLLHLERRKFYKVTSDASYIQKKREEEARTLCCNYIHKMTRLGFSKEEAIHLISGSYL